MYFNLLLFIYVCRFFGLVLILNIFFIVFISYLSSLEILVFWYIEIYVMFLILVFLNGNGIKFFDRLYVLIFGLEIMVV